MFDIAWSELLLIAVIALIFIGPKEVPQVLHSLGRMTAKLRRSADDFRRQFEDSVREAGYEDLHKNIQEFRSLNPATQLKDSIARAINQEYPPKSPGLEQAPVPQPLTDQKPAQPEQEHPAATADAEPSRQPAVGVSAPPVPLTHVAHDAGVPEEPAPAALAAGPSKDRVAPAP